MPFSAKNPKTWSKYLKLLLFAYREVPEKSTGFSPFELVYGWPVTGPLSLLKHQLLSKHSDMNVVTHVCHIRETLKESMELANSSQLESEKKMKTWYDQKVKLRTFEPGDEVLILLPTSEKSLESQWQGPFKIMEKIGDLDYLVEVGKGQNKRRQKYHINMLKEWKTRQEISCFANELDTSDTSSDFIVQYNSNQTENHKDINISEELTADQRKQLTDLLEEYSDMFTDVPGVTHLVEFDIDTSDAKPIYTRPYPIPHKFREDTQKEIDQLLKDGIIIESDSEWCSPVVIAQKFKDGIPKGIGCVSILEK